MKEEHQIKEQLSAAYKDLENYTKADYGTGAWHRTRGHIDSLEWVLEIDSKGS